MYARNRRTTRPELSSKGGPKMVTSLRNLLVGFLLLMAGGCSDHVTVTGKDDKDPTFKGTQSETASATSFSRGHQIFVVAYNDDTEDGKIVYTATDRVVFPGASMLGWSYSNDRGKTWSYGGKVTPPKGIGAL